MRSPLSVSEALKFARDTRCLELGPEAITRVPTIFREQFGELPAMVVADPNTFKAAGQTVQASLQQTGIPAEFPFVFQDPQLYAEHCYVEMLEAVLRQHPAIPIAIGSGTINDLTKLAAHRLGRPYLCVATAASMDGYTAYGASITYQGSKQTFFCPAPRGMVADLGIICAAPPPMRAWGYADLLAKVTAGADWIVADALGAETIVEKAWTIVQGGLRDTLNRPAELRAGTPDAVGRLMEGLLLGGFAMQLAQSSRPASGAEHQFSHLWDMQHHTHNGQAPSHGFKVGIGTLAVTALYEELLRHPIEKLDVDESCQTWPDLDHWIQQARTSLVDKDLVEVAVQELRAKHCDRALLRSQLMTLRKAWPGLRAQLERQLLPLATVRGMLQAAGALVEPEQIGISRERLRQSYWQAYFIRRRFTILDLAVRANLLNACVERIFSRQGRWPLQERNVEGLRDPV